MRKVFQWGIMGGGGIAGVFAQAIERLEDHNLWAVASLSGKPQIPAEKNYTTYEELAADKEVDAIYIATLHPQHLECVKMALSAGKPVLCEKPLGMTAHEAREMTALSKEKGVFFMEAMWTRTLPAMRELKKICSERRHGQIESIRISFGYKPDRVLPRLSDPKLGGGALLDIGVYGIHVANFLTGEKPQSVKAIAELSATGVDTETIALLTYPCGARADIRVSQNGRMSNDMFLSTTEADFVVPYFWRPEQFYRYLPNEPFKIKPVKETYNYPLEGNGYEYEADEVAGCVRAGQLESPLVTHESSIEVMQILDDIRKQCKIDYPGYPFG